MPKIIENLRERILDTAREALVADGWRALSMRALAQRVGVAPGTIYNYFSDKEEIVATLALADWQDALARMDAVAAAATDLERGLCDALRRAQRLLGRLPPHVAAVRGRQRLELPHPLPPHAPRAGRAPRCAP